jgi:hypothetical protein
MSQLFDKGREKFLRGEISWNTDDIRMMLVDTGSYPFSAADEFLDAIVSAGGEVDRSSAAFTGKTTTNGVADADDHVITGVAGATIEAIAIFKWTGSDATSPLIAWIDAATGLPLTPNSGDVTTSWDNGANRIFKL